MTLLRLSLVWLASLGFATAAELNVYAAASLSDVLRELAPKFHAATGHTLRFNFGASGTLARQIKEGAPADVFFSADELRLQQLEAAGQVLPEMSTVAVANVLVLIAPIGSPLHRVSGLAQPGVTRIAVGDPTTVPAGTYAKEYLQRVHLWDTVAAKRVPLENVRAVRAAVESGDADAGFVYRTDALGSRKLRVVEEITGPNAPRIVYPLAILKGTSDLAAARQLMAYLAGPEAQGVFARFGFTRTGKEGR